MLNQEEKPIIKKIMEKDSAIKVLQEIKENIAGVDLTAICEENITISNEDLQDMTIKRVIQAIQCGLVYWDNNENVLVQKLIKPLISGELEAKELKYKNRLCIKELKNMNSENQLDLLEKALSQITGRASHLIGKLTGQDIQIATGCLSFFAV